MPNGLPTIVALLYLHCPTHETKAVGLSIADREANFVVRIPSGCSTMCLAVMTFDHTICKHVSG